MLFSFAKASASSISWTSLVRGPVSASSLTCSVDVRFSSRAFARSGFVSLIVLSTLSLTGIVESTVAPAWIAPIASTTLSLTTCSSGFMVGSALPEKKFFLFPAI